MRRRFRTKEDNILPTAEILAEYEHINPGLAEQLLEMAKYEQEKRHLYNKTLILSYRAGQFFGFLAILSVIAGTIFLAVNNETIVASSLAIGGFIAIAITSLLSKPSKYKPKRNFKNNKKR